eukprot:62119-Pleurochrysis_carterae.AAC.3
MPHWHEHALPPSCAYIWPACINVRRRAIFPSDSVLKRQTAHCIPNSTLLHAASMCNGRSRVEDLVSAFTCRSLYWYCTDSAHVHDTCARVYT